MKMVLLAVILLYLTDNAQGQQNLTAQPYEIFQLSKLALEPNSLENVEVILLKKESPFNIFEAVTKINAKVEPHLGSLVIPKTYFYSKDYCLNVNINCYIEFYTGTKTIINEVIVAKNKLNSEFFLLQSAFEPMRIENDTFIAIQPVRVATNKVLYLKFQGNQNKRNKYQLIENDLTQSSNRLISNIVLEKSKYIDFFKLKENKILYGGVTPNGQHWFDSLFIGDK